MKRLSIFIVSCLLILQVVAQEIPNADFENWVKTGNYEDPLGWTTPNMLLSALMVSSVKKEFTDVRSGLYSARLENVEILGGMYRVPGFMTLGMFTFDPSTFESNIFGGIPYTNRPKKFKGYYKYTPSAQGDTGLIAIVFFVYDTILQKKDTIGGGRLFISKATTGWEKFEINIDYNKPVLPDSMNIVFLSSQSMQTPPGTVLLIDSLYFDHLGSIDEKIIQQVSFRVTDRKIEIWDIPKDCTGWVLYDIAGRKVTGGLVTDELQFTVNVNDSGFYLLSLQNKNGLLSVKIAVP